jgi:hypothetical protein
MKRYSNSSPLSHRPSTKSRFRLLVGNSDRSCSGAAKLGGAILLRSFPASESLLQTVAPSQCELGRQALACFPVLGLWSGAVPAGEKRGEDTAF